MNIKGKGKGICLESKYPCDYTIHMFFRIYLPWQWAHSSLQLVIQPWICAPGTHHSWVDWGSVEYEICLTLLHMVSTRNRTPDLLILSSNTLSSWRHAPINTASLLMGRNKAPHILFDIPTVYSYIGNFDVFEQSCWWMMMLLFLCNYLRYYWCSLWVLFCTFV